MDEKLKQRIKDTISSDNVMLFMKGTADFPQCGFSGVVVDILERCKISFKDVNILEDLELREGLKEYSDWYTYPQLYIKGELIGGADILKEMYENGELIQIAKQKGVIK